MNQAGFLNLWVLIFSIYTEWFFPLVNFKLLNQIIAKPTKEEAKKSMTSSLQEFAQLSKHALQVSAKRTGLQGRKIAWCSACL